MINKENFLKKALTHAAAIILFLGISLIYFSPQFEGKVLPQHDIKQYVGASQELRDYYEKDGESSTWTNSMFSGMPSYHVAVWGGSPNFLDYVEAPLKALGNNAGPVFTAMLMAYILFIFMGVNPFMSIVGAIAYSLSSYNIIILDAGHVTKAWAIAYLPLIVVGMMVMFRRKYLLGGILMALGLALQIKSNHLQITYYTGILCVFIFIALAIELLKEKKAKDLAKATAILVAGAALAIICNFGNLYANYEMGQTSTRGKSELTGTPNPEEKKSTGLDKDYAFAWSYGKAETLSLLIPDIYGGASGGTLDSSTNFYKEVVKQGLGQQIITNKGAQANLYWGDQPFTSGPVYIGAIVCFLFLLGMIVIPSRVKWTMLIATIFFIFLSWGRNFDWFNDFLFHHLPMYNKFRTVSMALVIPGLTIVMIAVWGLKEFFSETISIEKQKKSLMIAAGITGGICLLFALLPGLFFDFITVQELQYPDWYQKAIAMDRKDLLSSDAFRSLVFVLVAAAVLWVALNSKKSKATMVTYSTLGIAILMLIDLWGIDKRYLNDDHFISKKDYEVASFKKSVADEIILEDKGISQRVLALGNPFNETNTSYYHKSIGGYSAAKLKRYQELIDHYLQREVEYIHVKSSEQLKAEIELLNVAQASGEQPDVQKMVDAVQAATTPHLGATNSLAMLNAKYIIYHPELPPIVNPYAMGNAWFVSDIKMVKDADTEIVALGEVNVRSTAIVDERFGDKLTGLNLAMDSTATITLAECKPNMLKYKSNTSNEQLAVFSEIYYEYGWQAYVDGKPADHLRADWTLRAMRVPAGEHEIEFRFEPVGYNNARTAASTGSGLLVLIVLLSIGYAFVGKERSN